jgi:zinc protease
VTGRGLIVLSLLMLGAIASAAPAGREGGGKPALRLLASDTPIVAFRILFRTGSQDDPPGQEGITALAAQTVAEGGTGELPYDEVVKRLYPMAARLGVQVDTEMTVFTGEVHRDHLEAFYRLFSGLLLSPRFDAADFERNRDLQLNELRNTLRGNDDESLGKAVLNGALFAGHPYGHETAGTVQALEKLSLADVKSWYRSRFHRGRLTIGLAGGYPDGFPDRVMKDLAALPEGDSAPPVLPAVRPAEGITVTIAEKPCIATAISIGLPLRINRSDPDFYALLLATSYLGEHRTFNGVLMNQMRGVRGLNYGDYAYTEKFREDGGTVFPASNIAQRQQFWSIWIRPLAHDNAHFALRQAVRELDRLAQHGLTPEQFETTRAFLLSYSRLWTQSISRRLGFLLDGDFYGVAPLGDELARRLPALTLDEVNRVIRTHLQARNLDVAIVTPAGKKLLEALLADLPSPIHYQAAEGTPETVLAEDREIERFPLKVNPTASRVVAAADLFER